MRFSASVLWKYQMDFFASQGVNAWLGQVPFFITSNPHIGISYAEVMFAYIKDMVVTGRYDASKPFYVLELGTGTGKFSFYCLKKLNELVEFEFADKVKICYVMSDFTMNNVDFWRTQPQLKKFLDLGLLEFACLDMTDFDILKVLQANRTLEKSDFVNGLMVVGNYIFDTVPHDAFSVQNHTLFEARCSVETKSSNIENRKPKDLEKLNVSFRKSPVKKFYPEYNDSLIAVLNEYKESLQDTTFLIPISGIKTLDMLANIAGGRMLLISTDKGATHLAEIEGRGDPSVVFHGSFSMMVNFHAMARYNELCGGDAMLQPCHQGIKTVVMSRGFKFNDYKYLTHAVSNVLHENSPAQFFHLHRHLRQDPINYGLDTIISYLIKSHWDPYVFGLIHQNLMKRTGEISSCHMEVLDLGIDKLVDNIFELPNRDDPWQLIAMYFQVRGLYEFAAKYSNLSIKHKGEGYHNLINLGFALLSSDKPKEAIEFFQRASKYTKDHSDLKNLIAKAQKKLSDA